ncbi:MAG: hypothetical protein O9341_21140 [Paucibacter sp.]|nr:hypothetical protein [Roseateles sp.]
MAASTRSAWACTESPRACGSTSARSSGAPSATALAETGTNADKPAAGADPAATPWGRLKANAELASVFMNEEGLGASFEA